MGRCGDQAACPNAVDSSIVPDVDEGPGASQGRMEGGENCRLPHEGSLANVPIVRIEHVLPHHCQDIVESSIRVTDDDDLVDLVSKPIAEGIVAENVRADFPIGLVYTDCADIDSVFVAVLKDKFPLNRIAVSGEVGAKPFVADCQDDWLSE